MRMDRKPPISLAEIEGVTSLYVGDTIVSPLTENPEESIAILSAIHSVLKPTSTLYSGSRNYAPWLRASLPSSSVQGGSGVLSFTPESLNACAVEEMLEDMIDRASRLEDRFRVILSRTLPESMWGFSAATDLMSEAEESLPDVVDYVYDIEAAASYLCRTIRGRKAVGFKSNQDAFSELMLSSCKIISSLYSIYSIESFFEREVKTPARWFFPGNVLDDLKESYAATVNFIMLAPALERALLSK